MSKDNSCILVISDLQAPYHHPDVLDFLAAVKKKYKPTLVINIGDLADFHGLNFHGVNPNLPSAKEELVLIRRFAKNLAKIFPRMLIVDSNHDALPARKAKSAGIPREMMHEIHTIMDAPKTWKFLKTFKTTLPNGIRVLFKHNFSSNLLNDAFKKAISLCCGHWHTKSFVQWFRNDYGFNFAMQVGCLIDETSEAFEYAENNPLPPILTTGIVLDGVPFNVPMLLNKKGKWVGKV